jgi:hypothetical protein
MFDIIAHCIFYSEQTVSVCIVTLYSVFVLWRALYLEGPIFGDLYLFGGVFARLSLDHPDTSIPAASKKATLIFRDQNYVFRDIHFVCVYTPCLYTRYT